ncbi:hypothetical protein ACIPI6_31390 [Pseudomonas protegens]|uniref:hypothetical protein n=1 Tax=Pseudomonas protegens TaxID=380021 RepID=UPI0038296568
MARQEINLGVLPNGVGGDTPRVANTKINDMTEELYAAIDGGGKVQTVAGVEPDGSKDVPKAELATALGIDEKVDKVEGKGLSSNDYTTPEKTKLSTLVNPASYGVGGPAPLVDNIYQVKDGGITYWNQATTGRPPTGGQGNLISMTGGLNGSASTFLATSLDEDKVFFSRVNGATRAPWKQFLLAGDQGIGGPAIPVPEGDCDKAVAAGVYRTIPTTLHGRNVYGLLEVFDYGDNGNSKIQRLTATYGHPIGEATWFRSGTDQGTRWSTWQRLVAAGDYGIGSDGAAVTYMADANDVRPAGKMRVSPETANGPGVYGTLEQSYYDTIGWTQMVISIADGTIFTRSKINGVIQSGGWQRQTPELITNANGQATKFADGTMICRGLKKPSGPATNQPAPGSGIYFDNGIAFTWPVPFVGVPPTVTVTCEPRTVFFGLVGLNSDPTLTGVADVRFLSFASGATGQVNYIALGRWK